MVGSQNAAFRLLRACAFPALALFVLLSCENPYVVHNLERPVYLTGIEVRSDQLEGGDPSHPLEQVFQGAQTSYVVTVPYNAEYVTVTGFPEAGAVTGGSQTVKFDLGQRQTSASLSVHKENRLTTVYTVHILRGLPEALLAGLELYISDYGDAQNLEEYERDNYIVNFIPTRDTYTVRVPAYANHVTVIARSYTKAAQKVNQFSYVFKNYGDAVMGADGRTPNPAYSQLKNGETYHSGPLPTWYHGGTDPVVEWGNIQTYPGGAPGSPSWFGTGFVNTADPNPRGPGKIAAIELTALAADRLNPKKYTIRLEREEGTSYLDGLKILKIQGASAASDGMNGKPRVSPGSGTAEAAPNRLIGGFAKTNMRYDAAVPDDANAVRIEPAPDRHLPNSPPSRGTITAGTPVGDSDYQAYLAAFEGNVVKYTYTPYYYDAAGIRYCIDSLGAHKVHSVQNGDPPLPDYEAMPFTRPNPFRVDADPLKDPLDPAAPDEPGIDLYFDVTDPAFQNYVRMEVVITVHAPSGPFSDKTYRVVVRRQKEQARLHDVMVVPYTPSDAPYPAGDGNVFKDVSKFSPAQSSYTVNVNAGRTHARILLDNDNLLPPPPEATVPGSSNRIITVTTPTAVFSFHKSGGLWYDNFNSPPVESSPSGTGIASLNGKNIPYADVELKNRSTTVLVEVQDLPNYVTQEYAFNLLSKNSNQVIISDASQADGSVRALYADGEHIGLTADSVMPGELVELTVEAYLGYFVDWTVNPYDVSGGKDGGVSVAASTISMGGSGVRLISPPGDWKKRVYRFYMPDENVTFSVKYRETATRRYDIAYVASEGRRDGGFGSGSDLLTAKSWGTASNDLQAVINSWDGFNFQEIWIHKGTYNPPALADFAAPFGYSISPVTQEDVAFVLRPGLRIYGGFEDTHDLKEQRFEGTTESAAARKTVLNGERPDGTRAYHVVLAAASGGAALDTLTITGAIGPEADSILNINSPGGSKNISRQAGGGIFNIDGSLYLTNVIIRNNKSTRGAGMYTVSRTSTVRSELTGVEFFSNTALKSGGGMYNEAGAVDNILIVTNSLFRENKSSDQGGGLYNDVSGVGTCIPSITNTNFFANSAVDGGGIYTAGGDTTFNGVRVEDNWASGIGAGIVNFSGGALFYNMTVKGNRSKGGDGIGIYNGGTMRMTNAALDDNKLSAGGPSGGGLRNTGTAVLSNVTIKNNSAGSGGGIANTGTLILANCEILNNEAGSGGGITNTAFEDSSAKAILVNVTLDNNKAASGTGGGIFNDYEGSTQTNLLKGGSVNVLLTNTAVTRNTGTGIYNRYWRFSGRGINLTLNNATIAGNTGDGVYTEKWSGHAGNYFGQNGYDDPLDLSADAPRKKSFPVYIRFRNSVVFNNSLTSNTRPASYWNWSGFTPETGQYDPNDRESCEYSLLEEMNPGASNLDGTSVGPGFGANYRPLSSGVLNNAADNGLYPRDSDALLGQLFWKTTDLAGSISYAVLNSLPVYGGAVLELKNISYFLAKDNSFNKGDLRNAPNSGSEAAGRTRPSGLDIGAYEN